MRQVLRQSSDSLLRTPQCFFHFCTGYQTDLASNFYAGRSAEHAQY